jgi:ABC-type polysaccharide/polyol phosphate export permease
MGGETPSINYFLGISIGLVLFLIGLIYMKKTEDKIVDFL